MLNITKYVVLVFFAIVMVGCGEDAFIQEENTPTNGTPNTEGTDPTPKPESSAASVVLMADTTSLGSGSSNKVTLTAFVRDFDNILMTGEPISFSASDGALLVLQDKTTVGGQAEAILSTSGDPTNRIISVSASAGAQSDVVDISVVNTKVSVTVNGDASSVIGEQKTLIFRLEDSDGDPIAFQPINVTSENGNTLSTNQVATNENGVAEATFTATVSGLDRIRVSALGATNGLGFPMNVSPDTFAFSAPAIEDMEIGNNFTVSVNWSQNGVAVPDGSTVKFSATRGILVPIDGVVTTTGGVASVQISSNGAGPTLITASTSVDGPSVSTQRNFIATVPASLTFQAEKNTVGPNGQSVTIAAVVRDANNNLVKNAPLRFSILQDNSGGDISNATGITDELGRAFTVYTSSAATTAKDGVIIQALVDNNAAINASVALTVAEAELFVKLGTDNKVESLGSLYQKNYDVLVTDAAGNAAPDKDVVVSVVPTFYAKGVRVDDGDGVFRAVRDFICPNEDTLVPDTSFNGILDPGEDVNNNGKLDPRNVASVPVSVTTDATGFARIPIKYSKEFADWVIVRLTVSIQVAGTESLEVVEFVLPAALGDIKNEDSRPGNVSPFGDGSTNCLGEILIVVP